MKEKERLAKKQERSNPDFRKKELEQKVHNKKLARLNSEVKEKERLAKKQKRSNPDFRKKELEQEVHNKKLARLNSDVKEKEVEKKRTARLNSDVKKKEVEKKRTARLNSEVKEKERLAKKRKRSNPDFRKKESEQEVHNKRIKREDPTYKEKERIVKATTRMAKRSAQQNTLQSSVRMSQDSCSIEGHTSLEDSVKEFSRKVSKGPVYVCTCCHQTWFSHSVHDMRNVRAVSQRLMDKCCTGKKSVDDKEWICETCLVSLKKGNVPKLSVLNGLSFPDKPPELELHALEERLISPRIPFMSIYQLPREGQFQLQGSVVNVPVDIAPTVTSLPRCTDDTDTVPIKLKKKQSFKSHVIFQNVRPLKVMCALQLLLQKDLYKETGVTVDEDWLNKSTNKEASNDEDHSGTSDATQSDAFSEVDADEMITGTQDTMLETDDDQNIRTLTFSPGEDQTPLSIFQDKDAEYLAFPTIYCGERRQCNSVEGSKLHYSDICKWELRAEDRRVASNVPNIFFKAKKLQIKQVADKATLAVKRVQNKDKKYTAKEMLSEDTRQNITNLDEGYKIFRTIRNSPPYLAQCKKDIMAMIRQLGLPTFFISLSAADTKWDDLLIMLGKLVDKKDYTEELPLHYDTKARLISSDPVTCARYFNERVQQYFNIVLKSSHEPVGKLNDFVYRVEFQNRGSCHIHALLWIENAPDYAKVKAEKIEAFVDQYISCSEDVPQEHADYLDIQKHKHSRTCRKMGKAICRFGYPIPPMSNTKLLEPYEGDNREKYEKLYTKIQAELNSKHKHDSLDECLTELEMTEEDYIKAVTTSIKGPKVFLKRKLSEIRINPYMKNLLGAWKANHDIQFVVDPYACAVYITDYISKSAKGMSSLMHNACKEARKGCENVRKQVQFIGNKFLNATEMCAQEAVYLVLQMPLVKKTRQVVFVNTCPPGDRARLLKSDDALKELEEDSVEVYCTNEITRYSQRPKQLENWCLADYVSRLIVVYPKEDNDHHDDPFADNTDDDVPELLNHKSGDESVKIDLTLKNGTQIKSRQKPRVLRYVRFSEKVDKENFCREQLMLFTPWRKEQSDLLHGENDYPSSFEKYKTEIAIARQFYECKSEELDSAMHQAEINTNETADHTIVAPTVQHAECEDAECGRIESMEFSFFNPSRSAQQERYDIGKDVGAPSKVSDDLLKGCIPDSEYHDLLRLLNDRQREFVVHVMQWVKTKHIPLRAFLTGGAGVGKSMVIKALDQALRRYYLSEDVDNLDKVRVLKCAPTGSAAFNIEGQTLHHAFAIPVQQAFQNLGPEKENTLCTKYQYLKVVIIDEISLVSNELFRRFEIRCRQIMRNNSPFGGLHILLVGDLFQLEPVSYTWIFKDLSGQYGSLATNLWKEYFEMYELTEIMRQKDDQTFAELLNRLREGNHTVEDIEQLKARIISPTDADYPHDAPHLFRTNAEVRTFNSRAFVMANTEKAQVKAISTVTGNVSKSVRDKVLAHLANDKKYQNHLETGGLCTTLDLAVGLHYDCTVNLDVEDGLTNGATCVLERIEYKEDIKVPAILWVRFLDNKVGRNWRQKYSGLYSKQKNKALTPLFATTRTFEVCRHYVTRQQFPLQASSARTIHKCQGYTLSKAVIHMGTRKLSQAHYTALSRVTNINSLYLLNLNEEKIDVYSSTKQEMQRLRSERQLSLCYTPSSIIPSALKVVFLNARSLHKHHPDICNNLYLGADIIGIAETRLTARDYSPTYALRGFQEVIRNDQKSNSNIRPPHGLAIYVREEITVSNTLHFSLDEIEFTMVTCAKNDTESVDVVFVYKACNCAIVMFQDVCRKIVHHLGERYIIMGDFNVNVMSDTSKSTLTFMEKTFRSKQLICDVTTNKKTCIDLAFSSVPCKTSVMESVFSDHKALILHI